MTDNDIMKNVRCCADHYCKNCSLQGKPNCTNMLLSFAWNTMYDQKAEIERLISRVSVLAEIEKDYALKYGDDIDVSIVKKQIKTEAIKEFAQKLKEHLDDFFYTDEDAILDTADLIDNLVKEMTD